MQRGALSSDRPSQNEASIQQSMQYYVTKCYMQRRARTVALEKYSRDFGIRSASIGNTTAMEGEASMTCRIESISCQIRARKKPQSRNAKATGDAAASPTALAARAARSHLAPLTPPPCALSPCALTRTPLERVAQGTRRATIGYRRRECPQSEGRFVERGTRGRMRFFGKLHEASATFVSDVI